MSPMIWLVLIIFLVGLILIMRFMQRKQVVTIQIIPKILPEGDKVYIVGNHDLLGSWMPELVPLEKQDDGSWCRQFLLRRNSKLEFKITRGSWHTEAADAEGKVLPNFTATVNSDKKLTLHIENWRDLALSENEENGRIVESKPEDRITGTVKFHRKFKAKGLQPRDIIVWLPLSYDDASENRYPVLYMHDGQNIFDPVTSYTGVDWEADETATDLIEEGKIREIIIVGIYNTPERLEEYSASPKGKLYREFIINELKPLIDKIYRTLPGREHTATIGSSMGGLVSFLLAWNHPEVFSMAGCLSPSFIFRKNQAIKLLKRSKPPQSPLRIYMDCGGIGGERLLHKGCKKVLRILRNKGICEGKDFRFSFYKKANHSETAWAERLWRHLVFIFDKTNR